MIPLATTTVTLHRPQVGDPYETPSFTVLARRCRAHISSPSGGDVDRGGQQERIDAVLLADVVCGLAHSDEATDDRTGVRYRIVWSTERRGLGLDHTKAGLRRYEGAANG